jgi:hypothetical protein
MSLREVRAGGLEAVLLATELLQRARRANPEARLREAADVQWWWREPRRSDGVEKLFWFDDQGPLPASCRQAGLLKPASQTRSFSPKPRIPCNTKTGDNVAQRLSRVSASTRHPQPFGIGRYQGSGRGGA